MSWRFGGTVECLPHDVLAVVVIDLHVVERLEEAQMVKQDFRDIAPHALRELVKVGEFASAVDERRVEDGQFANERREVGEHGFALRHAKVGIILVAVYEGLGMEWDVGKIGPCKLRFVARDRVGDALRLVVENESEQVVTRPPASVTALVYKDAELIGHWASYSFEKNSRGTPQCH